MFQKRKDDVMGGEIVRQHKPTEYRRVLPLFGISFLVLALGVSDAAAAVNGYISAGIGNAKATFDKGHLGFDQEDISPNQTAWRLFGGGQVNRYFGVEAGYVHLGKPRAHTEPAVSFFEAEVTGFDVTPVGILPIGKGLSAFARGGLIFWHSKMTSGSPDSDPETKTATASNLALGLGVKYDIGRYFAARAEFTRYAISKTKAGLGDYNFLSISGMFVLGRK